MSSEKISALAVGTPKLTDLFVAVDVTDTSMGLTGTDKQYTSLSVRNFFLSGLGSMALQEDNGVSITGGAIDGTIIGDIAPAKGTFDEIVDSAFVSSGVVHNDSGGAFSSSPIVNADITNNTITNAKLSTMPTQTIKGNNTGGSDTPLDLTASQVKTMLGLSGGVSLTDTQVGFGDSGNNVVGSSNFTYNSSTGLLNIGGGTPESTSLLEMTSTTKTFNPPRMTTTQRTAIMPSIGCGIVFDTTLNQWCGFNGSSWSILG